MKKAVIVNFAYWDRQLKRVHTWGDVVFVDVYEPEELAEHEVVKDVREKIKKLDGELKHFEVSFTDITEKVVKEFPIENIDLLHKMATVNEPFALFEPKLWKDKIGDSLWHCAITSVGGIIVERTDGTMEGAIRKCYEGFVGLGKDYSKDYPPN